MRSRVSRAITRPVPKRRSEPVLSELFHDPFSPFCRKVRLVLEEKRLDYEMVVEPVVRARLPQAVCMGERLDLAEALREEPVADGLGELLDGGGVRGLRDHAPILAAASGGPCTLELARAVREG